MHDFKFDKKTLKTCVGLNTEIPWNEVIVEVNHSRNGIARLFINGCKTFFYTNGYGYCKNSTLLADFLNYWVGEEISNSGGAGVERVKEDALKKGVKLEYICETKDSRIYKFFK